MSSAPDRRGRLRPWVSVYLKGVAMGAADAIPGVSGGTIALIVGIYERLVDAIAGLSTRGPALVETVITDDGRGRFARIPGALGAMDVPFLVVLGFGVLTGVVAVANVVDFALETYRASTFAFFFGVIVASPVVLRGEISLKEPGALAAGLVGVVAAFLISGLPAHQADVALPLLFPIGAVAISAMVLPGISGSLILLVLGAYHTMTGAVSDLTGAVLGAETGATNPDVVGPLAVLVVFSAGALVGVITVARVVSWAIDAYRTTTMTFLVGVMFGALRAPADEILSSVETFTPEVIAGLLLAGFVGVVAVVGLEYVGGGVQ